jgi:hypothetical protein
LRCRRRTADSANSATDQSAGRRAAPTTGNAANRRARTGTQQTAANGALPRIVGISAPGQGQ